MRLIIKYLVATSIAFIGGASGSESGVGLSSLSGGKSVLVSSGSAVEAAATTIAFTNGDLILGFQATGGTGGTSGTAVGGAGGAGSAITIRSIGR